MDFFVSRKNVWSEHVDARILPVFEGQKPKGPAKLSAALEAAEKRKAFAGKKAQVFETESAILVGLGPKKEFKPPQLLRAVGSSYPVLKRLAAKKAAVGLSGFEAEAVNFAAQGLLDAAYRFDEFKSEKTPELLASVSLVCEAAGASEALFKAKTIASAVRLCRDLDNQPANIASPQYMAAAARKLSQGTRLTCTVLDEKQLAKKGFKALLAVGQGSQNPPRLVILEYRGGKKSDPWLAFVGKGITFDTGGISIKPSADMDKMKFDKSGACAVLSAMSALSKLGVKRNVVGLAAFAENMPSGSAYRPGDVIGSLSGKTIEVLNTDAEGRLVLADALHYAFKTYTPQTTVNLATLTGACVVALGEEYAGLFSNDDAVLEKVRAAAQAAGESVWPMPIEPYEDLVKGDVGDVKNVGHPRGYAGASTAAAFLKQFVSGPWAHVDIAGTAWVTSPKPYLSVGATGSGVRLLLELASRSE